MMYWTCPDCGANLDHGERCDCCSKKNRPRAATLKAAKAITHQQYITHERKMSMKISMKYLKDTKTCYRFERRQDDGSLMTLYLKKSEVDAAGIKPENGIVIEIKEDTTNA